jgi:hypothetical protein
MTEGRTEGRYIETSVQQQKYGNHENTKLHAQV